MGKEGEGKRKRFLGQIREEEGIVVYSAMGMLALNRLMSMQRDKQRRRRQILSRCEIITSSTGKRKEPPWEQDGHGDSQAGKITRSSIPDLPEDILFRIHCLMPMREAARAACVSRAFLHSWRCHPNLIFNKDIGLKKNGRGENFHHKIDRILRNHSGISLKTFKLDYSGMCGFDGTSYLDSWLQIALKPGIEELTLWLSETNRKYNFPCSLLADGVGNSLQYLKLRCCTLRPTVELGPHLINLTSLHLWHVSITWDELKCLLSNSLALEQLELVHCVEITCLKIPCSLQQLSSLTVFECSDMNVIESKAPNLSSLFLKGHKLIFSRVETLQMKTLDILRSNFIRDARANLPSLMPNLETLVINSGREVVDVPMLPTKFLYLKHLTIWLMFGPTSRPYDYFSLVSFIDASPCLETLVLDVSQIYMVHESICADSQLRHVPEHRHACLKSVKISGFSSAKSLFELVYYIVKNAVSLQCLTLDTIYGHRCDEGKYNRCIPMSDELLMETPRALAAMRTYIKNKVPSTVKLTVLEPCCRCHATGRWRILSQSGNAVSM